MRGGHQMCLLPEEGVIYLYGGWDGEVDLGDMWVYHIKTNKWQLISQDTSLEVLFLNSTTNQRLKLRRGAPLQDLVIKCV